MKHFPRLFSLFIDLILICGHTVFAQPGVARRHDVRQRPTVGTPVRPNILWITCEDMSAHLPSYGDRTVLTPMLVSYQIWESY